MDEIRKKYGDYIFIAVVFVIGILASVRGAWVYQQSVEAETARSFTAAARDRIELIKGALQTNENVLSSVVAFYRASENVSYDEFLIFANQLMKDHPYIQAIDWIPEVKGSERAAYEAAAQAWHKGFSFMDRVDGNGLGPASERNHYRPIYYTNRENVALFGFDFSTDPPRGAMLDAAVERRGLTASEGVFLLIDKTGKRKGVLFAAPVYQTQTTGDAAGYDKLNGFVVTVVPLDAMVENVLQLLNHEGTNILIHDLSAIDDKQLLYVRSTRLRDIPVEEILADYAHGNRPTQKAAIDVGGRKWQVTVQAAHGYFTPGVQRESYLILVGGILFTTLLVFYMQMRVRENETIEREVEERTRELARAKKQTEMILVSTSDGITGLDAEGKITFCNPRASNILGYSRREMIGQDHHALLHYRREDKMEMDATECHINDALLDRVSVTISDEVFWKKDGEALPVEYTASPIVDGDDLTGAVIVFRDITERKRLEKQLEQMARYDQLTGLANRTLFIDLLRGAIARAARTKKTVGVVYMDMNGFKQLNDTLGHAAGDVCLKGFAERVKSVVREYDVPARMGGDEFTILVDNLNDAGEGDVLIERLLTALAEPLNIAGHKFNLSASIGICFFPEHGDNPDTLIKNADSAMYIAKKDKTKRYVVYQP